MHSPLRLASMAHTAIRKPAVARSVLKDKALQYNARVHDRTTDPIDVLSEDWDTLVILDACRYDLFAAHRTTPGPLSARTSPGSSSQEFLERSFGGREAHDTVYTSANPYTANVADGTFYAKHNLFLSDWDEAIETVTPAVVAQAAIAQHETYPRKRHIVHFMQPHYPFIGPLGQALDHRGFSAETAFEGVDDPNIWELLERGAVPRKRVLAAYRENFEIVLEHVTDLLGAIDGKVIVSADHGNMIGERFFPIPVRGYDHPEGLHVAPLVTIPWNVAADGPRREIVAEPPVATATGAAEGGVTDEQRDERLRALGYKD